MLLHMEYFELNLLRNSRCKDSLTLLSPPERRKQIHHMRVTLPAPAARRLSKQTLLFHYYCHHKPKLLCLVSSFTFIVSFSERSQSYLPQSLL